MAAPKTPRGGHSIRAKSYKKLPLPEIKNGAYLRYAFFAVNRADRLSWTEIDAYARQTGVITQPWEAELLHEMNAEYLDGRSEGENPFSIMPMDQAIS